MANSTVIAKMRIGARFDALAKPGRSQLAAELHRAAPSEGDLDKSQRAAASAIAGSHGLVTVIGPASAGKTTMLRVAFDALRAQRRRMLVVAPTRKAASVASREVGTAASSLHALLADYGYRWAPDTAGATQWTRLNVGDSDSTTGVIYAGPTRYPLRAGDRVVVDEAGMFELQTANALTELALELRVGVAMVGDTHQALPVGHAGAMASAIRHATVRVELDTVHRFCDPENAALTLRLRDVGEAADAMSVAGALAKRGHLQRVDHHDAARDRMIDEYFAWHSRGLRVALVSGTNGEADAFNDAIQQRRVDVGELDARVVAWGMGEQRILVGDAVQTRRKDARTGGRESCAVGRAGDPRRGHRPRGGE